MKTSPNSISSSHSSDDGVQRLRIVHGIVNNWRTTPISMSEDSSKDQPRPPVYNPEDYAVALKKFTKRTPPVSESSFNGSDHCDTNGNDGRSHGEAEMSLRQFSSATELLNKLKTDLRVAYPSFVQEFVGDQIDGVNLLLELLKCIQATQSHQQGRAPPPVLRRSLIDENACLLCLLHCLRCTDTARCLATSSAGLYSLAVSTMSNVTKSRITALQLLTRTCESSDSNGHKQVSEAMSTLRLKFGEPVRFQFLIGMIIGSNTDLICTGLKFLNTFIRTAPSMQSKLYIQAEIVQAGLNMDLVRKTCQNSDFVKQEITIWETNFIDLEQMARSSEKTKQENVSLREKIALLERKIQKLHEEKSALINVEYQWKEKYNKLVDKKHRNKNANSNKDMHIDDEGISSSELEDELKRNDDEDINKRHIDRKTITDTYEEVGEEGDSNEEKEIVPTKLLPQPPRKYILNYCLHEDDEDDERPHNGFFDDDDEISENSNSYYCTQNTLINKNKENDSRNHNKTQMNKHSNTSINNGNVSQPMNSIRKVDGQSSSEDNLSDTEDSNKSFNYYIQNSSTTNNDYTNLEKNKDKIKNISDFNVRNTDFVKNTDTVRSKDLLEEKSSKKNYRGVISNQSEDSTNFKTTINNENNKKIVINNDVPVNTNNRNNVNKRETIQKIEERFKQQQNYKKQEEKTENYRNVIISKRQSPTNKSEIKIKSLHLKDNERKISDQQLLKKSQPLDKSVQMKERTDDSYESSYDKNVILKRSETFHNIVQNKIHNYQNVYKERNQQGLQNIVKPRRVHVPKGENHAKLHHHHEIDTQSENIKSNVSANYNIRRSSFDGLFYITSNNNLQESNTDCVNLVNSNYLNYVNIKFNNSGAMSGNPKDRTSVSNSGLNAKKYKSLEGISDGLESMVDIVLTNNRSTRVQQGHHIYKNVQYDGQSQCKLSDLPSGLY